MNNNIYILPVSSTFRDIKYPDKIFKTKDVLERKLRGQKLNIKINKLIQKEILSEIYDATLDNKRVFVKHIENAIPKIPTDFLIMNDAYNTDLSVMKHIKNNEYFGIAQIMHNLPAYKTLILEDIRSNGYTTLSNLILKKKLTTKSASQIGKALANFAKISQKWDEFKTNESAHMSYYERSLEMTIVFPNDYDYYRYLEEQFTTHTKDTQPSDDICKYFVWPDSKPSNISINKKGNIIFSNFERSYFGDQKYMLAVFVAHIMIYSVLGFIPKIKTIRYIDDCIDAYEEVCKIKDEKIFSQYVGMEILHRSFGKDFPKMTNKEKLKLQSLGLSIYEEKPNTVTALFNLFKKLK